MRLLQEAARALKGRALEALKAAAASHAEAQLMRAQISLATADTEVPAASRRTVGRSWSSVLRLTLVFLLYSLKWQSLHMNRTCASGWRQAWLSSQR